MKKLGYVIITIGFLAGALVAVLDESKVQWGYFSGALILGIVWLIINLISIFVPTIAAVLSWVALIVVGIILAIWLIMKNYKLKLGKAILVWLVWFILSLIVMFIIAMIIGVILAAILIGSMGAV